MPSTNGLLDSNDRLLAEPVAYWVRRTDGVTDRVHARVSPAELYAVTGPQFLPFNTVYQLAADQDGELWPRASRPADLRPAHLLADR